MPQGMTFQVYFAKLIFTFSSLELPTIHAYIRALCSGTFVGQVKQVKSFVNRDKTTQWYVTCVEGTYFLLNMSMWYCSVMSF